MFYLYVREHIFDESIKDVYDFLNKWIENLNICLSCQSLTG